MKAYRIFVDGHAIETILSPPLTEREKIAKAYAWAKENGVAFAGVALL